LYTHLTSVCTFKPAIVDYLPYERGWDGYILPKSTLDGRRSI